MLPKLENKTQTGTIVYIVLLIIKCSIYSVQQIKAYARLNIAKRQQSSCSAAVWHGVYRTRIGRVLYSINAFVSAFYFEKSCWIEAW